MRKLNGNSSGSGAGGTSSIVVAIVDALEDHGLEREMYQLYEYVDPNALENLVKSVDDPFTVTFTVKTVRVTVTEEGLSTTEIDQT